MDKQGIRAIVLPDHHFYVTPLLSLFLFTTRASPCHFLPQSRSTMRTTAASSTVSCDSCSPELQANHCTGTLMAPTVMYRVICGLPHPPEPFTRKYTFAPAIVEGYCRRRVLDRQYPGITA